jgi:glycosyltransferase involved in cell wall biosynthesis
MRIVYLADTHIPSRATNGIQVMRMCAAFASKGAEVTLVHPHRFGNRPEGYNGDLWSFYGVQPDFRVVTLPTPLTLGLAAHRRFARVARGAPLSAYTVWRSRPGASPYVAYSRSLLGTWLTLRARALWGRRSACRGVFVELHDAPRTAEALQVVRRADGVVVISGALRDRVIALDPAIEPRIVVQHDGVDLDQFAGRRLSRGESRQRLRLDQDAMVVAYTGRVNNDKGIPTVLRAAERLDGQGVSFLLVGKVYDGLGTVAGTLSSVTLTGFVPPSDVPDYTAAADALVMPTSARIAYGDFTSPLKLFEYMASGLPVVASDLPVLREVLEHERNALLFRADDADSLCQMICTLRIRPQLGAMLAKHALQDVSRYTWQGRASRVLDLVRTQAGGRLAA